MQDNVLNPGDNVVSKRSVTVLPPSKCSVNICSVNTWTKE